MSPTKKKDEPTPDPAPRRTGITLGAPLGFFALALVVVEAFLGLALLFGNLEPAHRLYCVLLGVGLFALIVGVVSLLAWFKPVNLIYDRFAHLIDRGKIHWGSADGAAAPEELFPHKKDREAKP